MTITFGSLFAGIGGFDLGFERAGMACKWQVEIDDYATRVLEKHWPGVHRERDIKQCGKHNLEQVDVICGGFPCQDISYAGRGAGLDGERSGLFFEAVRVVRELQPRVVVLENVAALLTRGLDRVLGTLAEIGFDAEWHCIPAAAIGAPHIRDRVFVLAYATGERCGETQRLCKRQKERPSSRRKVLADAQINGRKQRNADGSGGDPRDRAGKECRLGHCGHATDTDSTRLEERQGKDSGGSWAICRTKPFRSEWWSIEPPMGRVANGVPRRVDRLRGLGNAVVPQVAEWIGKQVVDRLAKEARR